MSKFKINYKSQSNKVDIGVRINRSRYFSTRKIEKA